MVVSERESPARGTPQILRGEHGQPTYVVQAYSVDFRHESRPDKLELAFVVRARKIEDAEGGTIETPVALGFSEDAFGSFVTEGALPRSGIIFERPLTSP